MKATVTVNSRGVITLPARLRQRGFDHALIGRMVCPIGLPGITGKEPEVIAVAVVAQLLRVSAR